MDLERKWSMDQKTGSYHETGPFVRLHHPKVEGTNILLIHGQRDPAAVKGPPPGPRRDACSNRSDVQ